MEGSREDREAAVAVNRFSLGARPGELEAAAADPQGWLLGQLAAARLPDALAARPASGELLQQGMMMEVGGDRTKRNRVTYEAEAALALQVAVESERGFFERLVAFWSNHLAVSVRRTQILAAAGAYEREVIRPLALGRFEEMVIAATKHPAMLIFLDNHRSMGPDSRVGQRRSRGLNENLAREVMELHTVGVDAGYTQSDVEAMAALLTGWGVDVETQEFVFRDNQHQPGHKIVMGRRYGEGLKEGERALRDLARHPATARRLSRKLAQHFSRDLPEPALVDELERVWLDTWGQLEPVCRALVTHPAAWALTPEKIKSPRDLVLSTARALAGHTLPLRTSLEKLGQPLWAADSPQGFPDTADSWLGPAAVIQRVEWVAFTAAQTRSLEPEEVGSSALGGWLSERTRRAIGRCSTREEGLALLLASSEFQRR